jgi:hypothetical protein
MFGGLFQPMHLLVIVGLALLVFGPKKCELASHFPRSMPTHSIAHDKHSTVDVIAEVVFVCDTNAAHIGLASYLNL